MSELEKLYALHVIEGIRTIESVPEAIREEVKKMIETIKEQSVK